MKKFNLFAIMFLIGIGGTSTALAQIHRPLNEFLSGADLSKISKGGVAGVNVPGIGFNEEGNVWRGVAAVDADLKYGKDIVVPIAQGDAEPPRRVPAVNGR